VYAKYLVVMGLLALGSAVAAVSYPHLPFGFPAVQKTPSFQFDVIRKMRVLTASHREAG
jgi:hypothetical protein